MTQIEAGEKDVDKLVQVPDPLSLEDVTSKKSSNKKRIRRIADPHIESYKSGGSVYYRYRRGEDEPIYLGSATSILKAMTGRGK